MSIKEYIHIGTKGKDYFMQCCGNMKIRDSLESIDDLLKTGVNTYKDDFCININEGNHINYADREWYEKAGYKEKTMSTPKNGDVGGPMYVTPEGFVLQQFDLVETTDKSGADPKLGWIVIHNGETYVKYADHSGYDLMKTQSINWAKRLPVSHFLKNLHSRHDEYKAVFTSIKSKEVKLSEKHTAKVFKDKVVVGCSEFSLDVIKDVVKTAESLR